MIRRYRRVDQVDFGRTPSASSSSTATRTASRSSTDQLDRVGNRLPSLVVDEVCKRKEFGTPGVYILTRPYRGLQRRAARLSTSDRRDVIRSASTPTSANKDFWDWGYAFVSKGTDSTGRTQLA